MKAPNNPKSQRCSNCKRSLEGIWWIQIYHNVFCKDHYLKRLKEYEKRKQISNNI
jgi:hypothetical protein